MAQEYLDIVATLKTPTSPSALKGHMFKITRPALAIHTDLRPVLGKARSPEGAQGEERVKEYREFLQELEKRLAEDRKEAKYYQKGEDVAHYYQTPQHLQNPSDRRSRPDFVPHWYLQPYFRPPLNPPKPKEEAAAEDTKTAHPAPNPSSEDRSAKRTKTA